MILKMNINMTDITEKTENGELVTNRDQLVVVDNIEHQDKGELVANCDLKRRTRTTFEIHALRIY